ncbi:hypothetical protein DERP_008184 [Dermatophagoides pteronyssinus]|uniref:Uncharacterized protein n=1 Tax=Dermatophagoides pteronyssinus TaxID=6956 RepID=A0ABQ8JJZ2_DERPT|nr:hypothetical protein DERP_008184 [Dermatophagoides pteronyssinus]
MLYRYLNGMRMFFGKYDILTQSHTGFKSGIIPFPVKRNILEKLAKLAALINSHKFGVYVKDFYFCFTWLNES